MAKTLCIASSSENFMIWQKVEHPYAGGLRLGVRLGDERYVRFMVKAFSRRPFQESTEPSTHKLIIMFQPTRLRT